MAARQQGTFNLFRALKAHDTRKKGGEGDDDAEAVFYQVRA